MGPRGLLQGAARGRTCRSNRVRLLFHLQCSGYIGMYTLLRGFSSAQMFGLQGHALQGHHWPQWEGEWDLHLGRTEASCEPEVFLPGSVFLCISKAKCRASRSSGRPMEAPTGTPHSLPGMHWHSCTHMHKVRWDPLSCSGSKAQRGLDSSLLFTDTRSFNPL